MPRWTGTGRALVLALVATTMPTANVVGSTGAEAVQTDFVAGEVSTLSGSGLSGATAAGSAQSAVFNNPGGVSVANGFAYVTNADSISKVDLSSGSMSILAGQPWSSGCPGGDHDDPVASQVLICQSYAAEVQGGFLYWAAGGSGVRRTSLSTGATSTVYRDDRFALVQGLTFGPDGSLYVVQGGNGAGYAIFKLDPIGWSPSLVVTSGGLDGSYLSGLDSDGTALYTVVDAPPNGQRIVRVPMANPSGWSQVATDQSMSTNTLTVNGGYAYVAARHPGFWCCSYLIRRYSLADGSPSNVAGAGIGFADGRDSDAWFAGIGQLAFDGQSIIVADYRSTATGVGPDIGNRIRRVVPADPLPAAQQASVTSAAAVSLGEVTTVAGSGQAQTSPGTGPSAGFNMPRGLAVVGDYAYVGSQDAISKTNLESGETSILTGVPGTGTGCRNQDQATGSGVVLCEIRDMVSDGRYLYWVSGNEVRRTSVASGATSTIFKAYLTWPLVALTLGRDRSIYVAQTYDGYYNQVSRLDLRTGTAAPLQIPLQGWVLGLAADQDYLYLQERVENTPGGGQQGVVKRYDLAAGGAPTTLTSLGPTDFGLSGTLAAAGGYLYGFGYSPAPDPRVVLRRVSKSDGSITTVAGGGPAGATDGIGPAARFGSITNDVASDGTNLFVADADGMNRLRRVAQARPAYYGNTAAEVGAADTNGRVCECADPVDTSTGALVERVTDLALQGRLPVQAVRTYSSVRADRAGLFGFGWSSPWDMRILTGSPTLVLHEDGAQSSFTPNPDGTFTSPADVFATLSRDPATGAYTYVRRRDKTFTFDATGRLASIRDRNGETTALAWSPDTVTVTASDGRALMLRLDAAGRVGALEGPAGRSVAYRYDTNGDLDAVTDARGEVWSYGYDSHRLTTMTSPLGHTTTTTYGGAGRVSRQESPRGGIHQFDYTTAPNGLTTRVTDPTGVVTDYVYRYGLLAARTVDPAGSPSTWTYEYDDLGNTLTATDPTGAATTSTFDVRGNPLTITNPAGHTTTFTYNAFNELVTATDAAGHVTSWTYDGNGNPLTHDVQLSSTTSATTTLTRAVTGHPADVTSVTDSDGRTTAATYTPEGFVASATNGVNAKTTWTYNPYGQVKTEVPPRGNAAGASPADFTTALDYNLRGDLISVTDPLGHATTYGYDDDSRLTSTTDPYAKPTTTSYTTDDLVKTVTDPLNRVTTYAYDLAGRLAAATAPDGGATTWTYDPHGRRASQTRPTGNAAGATPAEQAARTVTFGYDPAGHQTSVSQPDPDRAGQVLTATTTFDAAGRVWKLTNPNDEQTVYHYDNLDRVDSVTDPMNLVTAYGYDWASHRTALTDPLGRTAGTAYTKSGLVDTQTNPAGEVTDYGYDAAGRLSTLVDPRGTCGGCGTGNYTSTIGYDLDDNRTSLTDQLGHATTFGFDRAGRQTTDTDPNGRVTGYGYDNADRLTRVTGPDLAVTSYGYDDAGQLTSTLTPRLKTWNYAYDPAGRPASSTNPLGQTSRLTYTLDGDLATRLTARGNAATNPATGTVTYSHDPLGRLTAIAYGDGATPISYAFDKAGRVTSIVDAAGTQSRSYDSDGRLTSIARGSSTWGYSYYDDATPKLITRPDGTVETWTYDSAARPATSVTPAGTTSYGWDRASNLTSSVLPNGTTETQTWDRAGDLASIATAKGATTLARQSVTRDNAGNPTQTVTTRAGVSETRSYKYDLNDRLQGVCYTALTSCTGSSAATQWWTYDGDGNRLTEKNGTGTGTTTTYSYNAADQLTARKVGTAAATPYTYDADGNQLTDGTTTYTYDLNNRTASSKLGTTTAWQRDAAGNVLKQTAGATISSYDWDLNTPIPHLATATTSGTATSYRYDPLGRTATLTQAGATETLAHDPLGSVTDLITSAGAIARAYDYAPFGAARAPVGAPKKPTGATTALQYAGMLTADSGASYATRDRTYSTATGRWTATDPLTPPTTDPFDSPYTYVANQPTALIDPLGQSECGPFPAAICAPGEAVSAIGGGVSDTLIGAVRGPYDAVRDPDAVLDHFQQVYDDNGGGIKGRVAIFDQFNPVYHLMVGAAESWDAFARGDWQCGLHQASATVTGAGLVFAPLKLRLPTRTGTTATAAAKTGASGADDVLNGVRLRAQLTGQEISGGHAFAKHVGEFPGITTRGQFGSHVEDVVTNGVMRPLSNGRSAYWQNGTVVIRNPNAVDGGTAFRPTSGYDYFLNLH